MATQTEAVTTQKPPQHKEVENFSEAERTEWLKTGEMPLVEEPKTDSPSKEDASAASKPATTSGKESGSGPGKKERDEERNWRTLESDRDKERERAVAAEKELEEWRSGRKKPEEKKTETSAAPAPKLLEQPKRPKMTEFRDAQGNVDVVKYEEALDKYDDDLKKFDDQQSTLRNAEAMQRQTIQTWEKGLKEKYGEDASKVDVKKTVDLLVKTQADAPAVFFMLNDSEVFEDLLFVLGTDPKLNEFLEEAKKSPGKAVRRISAMEEEIRAKLADKGRAKAGKEEPSGDEPTGRVHKLTNAGKPPAEASGGGSAPEDDGSPDAAWKRMDLSKEERGELYRERTNKQEMDKRRKRR